jgi:hypothetical protein
MNESKTKPEIPSWQPTRLQMAKWHIKNYLGAAALLGVMALAVLLYLAVMAVVSHHLPRWLP